MSASSTRILVVDDEPADRDAATAFLVGRGFEVKSPESGNEVKEETDRLLTACEFDLLLLDLAMPNLDTLALIRSLNEKKTRLPAIMMSGQGGPADRIQFLEAGADDFIAKPEPPLQWRDTELLARIQAVLRRANGRDGTVGRVGDVYAFEGWSLDPLRRQLRDPGGVLVGLTDGEFRLLLALLREPGKVLARDELLGPGDASGRSIDVHVSRLRNKLERSPEAPEFIKTVRGGGYILAVPVQRP